MNRQQRRQRERDRKKRQKEKEFEKKNNISTLEHRQVMNALNAVKMGALLALRNDGYGATRLKRFSDDFNEIMTDVSHGRLSLNDISGVIEEETGLKYDEIRL